jgi:hypothetical protein
MDPFTLFKDPLTFITHERNDLHYIGEALPAPSLAVSVLSSGSPAFVGGSSVPAREDHVHALDLDDLFDAINNLPEPPVIDVDLSNYYTKAEIDAALGVIIDNFDNYYTSSQIDLLLSGLSLMQDFAWSWDDQICNPISTTESTVWYPPYACEIKQLIFTCVTAGGAGDDYIVALRVNGSVVDSMLVSQSATNDSATVSVAVDPTDRVNISIAMDGMGSGASEDVMITIRYE